MELANIILLAQTEGGDGTSGLVSFLPLILIFGVFYFLLIRPQRKRQRQASATAQAVKLGDEVQTYGGLFGRVAWEDEDSVILELEQGRARVARRSIARRIDPADAIESGESDE